MSLRVARPWKLFPGNSFTYELLDMCGGRWAYTNEYLKLVLIVSGILPGRYNRVFVTRKACEAALREAGVYLC